ncbi:MAG: ABC transporter substrate-binding protein, partial [Candidatus Heimdallarchaeaceae archaeon]
RKSMQDDPRFEVQSEVRDYFLFLAFNLQRSFVGGEDNQIFLTEPGKENYTKACAVRKAICYAIDREEMNNEFHDGEYVIAHNPMYPYTAFYYYDDVIKYDYNLDKAREWLAAAGYIKTETTNVITFSSILALLVLQISISVRRRKHKKNSIIKFDYINFRDKYNKDRFPYK